MRPFLLFLVLSILSYLIVHLFGIPGVLFYILLSLWFALALIFEDVPPSLREQFPLIGFLIILLNNLLGFILDTPVNKLLWVHIIGLSLMFKGMVSLKLKIPKIRILGKYKDLENVLKQYYPVVSVIDIGGRKKKVLKGNNISIVIDGGVLIEKKAPTFFNYMDKTIYHNGEKCDLIISPYSIKVQIKDVSEPTAVLQYITMLDKWLVREEDTEEEEKR